MCPSYFRILTMSLSRERILFTNKNESDNIIRLANKGGWGYVWM